MADPGRTPSAGNLTGPRPVGRYLRFSAAWVVGAAPAFAVLAALWLYPSEFNGTSEVALGAFALMFPIAVRELRVERRTEFVDFLLVAGIVFAVISILTGAANGLTDQSYSTPRFVGLLLQRQDPYVVPLSFQYQQYGQAFSFHSVYSFLPLLLFLQVPGLNYKWFALAAWAGMVLVARRRFDTGVMLAQPYVAILAANGYNDLVVLLLLTIGFVGWEGRRQKWAEWLALGCLQLANVFVVAYHLVRRDWRNVALTLVISGAFLLPFVLWSGPGILCPAVTGDRLAACQSGSGFALHLDDSVWLVWGVAVFYGPLLGALRRRASSGWSARQLARFRLSFEEALRLPAFLVVGVSGVFVNLCVFTVLGLRLPPSPEEVYLASAGAFAVALCWNFTWNRAWAFAGRGGHSTLYHFGLYGMIQLGALAVNLVVLAVAVRLGASNLDGQLAGIVVASLLGYGLNLRWNFRTAVARSPTG
ncbi:MAG TPA: GtrA family protein [Thermoplasmata archaeon]|nr:GtrA family protein [Thermoplasmata archaeon]